jgi:hypothetical protein
VEQSQPALNALHEWLIQTRIKTANGGGSAKALDYTLKRWPSLICYETIVNNDDTLWKYKYTPRGQYFGF